MSRKTEQHSPNWGGKRENAGRRSDGDRRVRIFVYLAQQTRDLIDLHRRKETRGKYIDKIVWAVTKFRR